MPTNAFPIIDAFYDWLQKLPKQQAVVAAASVLAIAKEGAYESGCADLGDGIWCYTTLLDLSNLHMCIYVFSNGKRYFPLHGVITNDPDVRGINLTEAQHRLGLP